MQFCFFFVLSISQIAIFSRSQMFDDEMENEKENYPYLSEVFQNPVNKFSIQMPGIIPKNETYLCMSYMANNAMTSYIVGFEPISDKQGVHHVLLFGCEEPANDETVWNCGEMYSSETNKLHTRCTSQPNILYAWTKNAPNLRLPEGVAFRIGKNTKNKFLILQVHYMHAMNEKDYSGVNVLLTPIPQPRTAATLLMMTDGQVQPKKKENFEAACAIDELLQMHPFAFRVHTHRYGKKVSGWVVKKNPITNIDKWTLLGEKNPQSEQLFEPIKNEITIDPGDVLAARCEIDNTENRLIKIGPTVNDEMCNFYLMYWVEGSQTLSDNICYSPGPPIYHWSKEIKNNKIYD